MKKKTARTVITMIFIGALIIGLYYYQTHRTDVPKDKDISELGEVELILQKDLNINYPASVKEVLGLYSRMSSVLYTNITDSEVEKIALKMRELFDEELLAENSESEHLAELKNEISIFRDANRKIRTYEVIESTDAIKTESDGIEYSTGDVLYRINEEEGKHKIIHRFMLRRNDDGKWKILGWSLVENQDKDAE